MPDELTRALGLVWLRMTGVCERDDETLDVELEARGTGGARRSRRPGAARDQGPCCRRVARPAPRRTDLPGDRSGGRRALPCLLPCRVGRAGLPSFDAFGRHPPVHEELLASFDEPTTNGHAEGVINKVKKVITRRAYGLPTFRVCPSSGPRSMGNGTIGRPSPLGRHEPTIQPGADRAGWQRHQCQGRPGGVPPPPHGGSWGRPPRRPRRAGAGAALPLPASSASPA
jgi:hypothetical protein